MTTLRTGAIVQALGGELFGDPDRQITRLAPLERAQPGELSFLVNPRLTSALVSSRAGCVIVGPALAEAARARGDCIVAADPHLYFARLTQLWRRLHGGAARPGIHPSAVVEEGALVDPSASVGALCFIGRGARIGAGTVLKARVTVGEDCVIGARCLIQSGAVIGGDGFGFAPAAGRWEKIEQLGAVRIGDDVEIGANTCIDRGALGDTVIGDGVKLDNLIQIGHNVQVGAHTVMAACVGVSGSTRIGTHCIIGGQVGIAGHLRIVDRVQIGAGSKVNRSILEPGRYGGIDPLGAAGTWEKNAVLVSQLAKLRDRIRALENRPD
mgnify:CR=1 FL=1